MSANVCLLCEDNIFGTYAEYTADRQVDSLIYRVIRHWAFLNIYLYLFVCKENAELKRVKAIVFGADLAGNLRFEFSRIINEFGKIFNAISTFLEHSKPQCLFEWKSLLLDTVFDRNVTESVSTKTHSRIVK